jgi:Leu/Phe-tRNA-protein transferase
MRRESNIADLFLPDLIALFQMNSLHSDDRYIHKDLVGGHHGLSIPAFFLERKIMNPQPE